MVKVYSLRRSAQAKDPIPPDAVYVGRGEGSQWGSPFYMNGEEQRDWACNQYERYARRRLEREPDWLEPLRGKSALVCFCQSPSDETKLRCHAETLVTLLGEVYRDDC